MTKSSRSDPARITHINVPKASDILAEQLRSLILNGQYQPGELLPAERDLVHSSGISRTSVRDALRLLEVEGLITTRPGRAGGSTVRQVGRDAVARPLQLYVRSREIDLASLFDCRLAVEPFLAGRTAANRTEADLAHIEEIHAAFLAEEDISHYKRLNLDWHLAIAAASHNDLLYTLMEAISDPIFETSGYQQATTAEMRKAAKTAHEAILEAVRARNEPLARKRMERHLTAYINTVSARHGDPSRRSEPPASEEHQTP
ncbi:DNA-binding FadR family transcriptional regulator [Palleronia aestuarii]|uniref:DNA-binding FadR family transcriptional regulator n=1 Tax=Palleronia aestuarii TaxID=568105 RepID=A0A2W7NP20_9RHOB|nr:FadR/GntR family transcriptional regulator [Palleronia aestuarii]PZX13022.1 DNA-binding FadR family transcriptional regulator [Palleronia aestuarii]